MGGAEKPWHADFEAAGYRKYVDGFLNKPDGWYICSWQKRVTDEIGTRYFISVDLWLWPDERRSVGLKLQMQEPDDTHVNFERSVTTIEDAEAFAARAWAFCGRRYYEADSPSPTGETE